MVSTACIGLAFFAAFMWYLHVLGPSAVFMDSLRFLSYVDDSISGRHSLWYTWNQGDHRGMGPQAVVYLNARYFGLNVVGASALSGLVVLATGMMLCMTAAQTIQHESSSGSASASPILLLSIVIFLTVFSLANWELYAIDVGVALFLKNFLMLGFWIALDRMISTGRATTAQAAAFSIAAAIMIFLITLGWSYPFVMVSLLIMWAPRQQTQTTRFRSVISVALLADLILYATVGLMLPKPELILPPTPAPMLFMKNVIEGFFMGPATLFAGEETLTSFGFTLVEESLLGFLCILLSIAVLYLNFRKRPGSSFIPSALILYALADSAAIAVGRARFDPWNATAARYYQDFSLMIVGITWSAVLLRQINRNPNHKHKPFDSIVINSCFAAAALAATGQIVTADQEWRKAPYRNAIILRMRDITRIGVKGVVEATYLQQNLFYAQEGSRVQAKYGIGVFNGARCQATEFNDYSGWYENDPSRWMRSTASTFVKNCGSRLRVVATVPANFGARHLSVGIFGQPSLSADLMPGQPTEIIVPVTTTSKTLRVELAVDHVTQPSRDIPNSADLRELGAMVPVIVSLP